MKLKFQNGNSSFMCSLDNKIPMDFQNKGTKNSINILFNNIIIVLGSYIFLILLIINRRFCIKCVFFPSIFRETISVLYYRAIIFIYERLYLYINDYIYYVNVLYYIEQLYLYYIYCISDQICSRNRNTFDWIGLGKYHRIDV